MDLRLDRLATLYLADPILRHRFATKRSVPILMYHAIADKDETGLHPYFRTATSPLVFSQHMQFLHEHEYRTITLARAVAFLYEGTLPLKGVVTTFDDGYSDFFRHAFPILTRFSFTATVFLPTAYIGTVSKRFKGMSCLTWKEVRELRKCGISFGSHTVTHPQLRKLKAKEINSEVVNSKMTIEDNLGESVDSFSYPFAFPDGDATFAQTLRSALAGAGYENGVSTRIGLARPGEDHYFLKRLPMNSLDDLTLFGAKLRGGYDWLYRLQYASKFIRTQVG
jgi:peptidoglycan/xylan/chitin deacetylase (PgdA/CDA1 family)